MRRRGMEVTKVPIYRTVIPQALASGRCDLLMSTQVCDILQLDASTLSRNVKPLQAHGWVEVVPGEDARAQPFRLTPKGKRLIEKAVSAWEEAQRRPANSWEMRGFPCSTKPPGRWACHKPAADRPVFFLDDLCIYKKRRPS